MRIFYSHSFTARLSPKVRAFRAILDEAVNAARLASELTPGRPFVATVVEGIGVDFADPVSSIFPMIEGSDVLISALFDETSSSEEGFVSAACLQEIIVAARAGKKTMVWVEEGCANRLGFIPHLTTYGDIRTDEMLLAEGRQRITRAITDRLLGATVKVPSGPTDKHIYINDFGPGSLDHIVSFEWKRAYVDEKTQTAHFEGNPRTGGQTILRSCGENGNDCLAISSTRDTWNWALRVGESLTTLAVLPRAEFTHGRELVFRVHCRSTGRVKLCPLLNGPATNPKDPDEKLTDHDWQLMDPTRELEWQYKSIAPEEGWVDKLFTCRVNFRKDHVLSRDPTLYLMANTEREIVLIDHISLSAVGSPSAHGSDL
jgi:hypothetical protein